MFFFFTLHCFSLAFSIFSWQVEKQIFTSDKQLFRWLKVPRNFKLLMGMHIDCVILFQNRIFILTNIQKANHNQPVFCQVQSPYVELVNPLSGRSQQRFINVLCMYKKIKRNCATWNRILNRSQEI